MSMFHELMMRKKEQIMYATIKGTLTENDGVFSGFSASNYLQVQNSLDLTKSWEIQLEFTTGNDISSEQFIFADTQNPSPIGFGIFTNSQFVVCYMNTQGQRTYTFIDGLSINTKYKVNLKYNKDEHKFYVYINGLQKVSVESIYSYSNRYVRLGVSRLFSSAFVGSIDLNKSYIKIDNTKYKLQAVVGYTIVGSPTESPTGVFGDLDSSNYLKIDNANILSQADNWEIMTKLVTVGKEIGQYFIGTNKQFCLAIGAGASSLYLSSNGTSWDIVSGVGLGSRIPANSYVRLRFTGTQYILDYSSDKLTWTKCAEVSSTTKITSTLTYIKMGIWYGDNTRFTGTLDMNETLIKVNRKLWFNGQQA